MRLRLSLFCFVFSSLKVSFSLKKIEGGDCLRGNYELKTKSNSTKSFDTICLDPTPWNRLGVLRPAIHA